MILFCFLFLFFSATCFAQFSDSLTHLISFGASGNINRTSTSAAYLLTNEARFSTKKKRITTNSSARWLYGEIDNKLSNNDFITTHDFNRFNQKGNFYYWGLANYTTSYSLRIYGGLARKYPLDDFIAGTVRPRKGVIERVLVDAVDHNAIEIVVVIRSVGTGGYLSADSFRYRAKSLVWVASVADLDKRADPLVALREKSKQQPKR